MSMVEYKKRPDYLKVFKLRATGKLPEMESSKAVAIVVNKYFKKYKIDTILDVGCGCGHYLRSLKKKIKQNFFYTGVDSQPEFVKEAKKIWKNSDASFFSGNIYNLKSFNKKYDLVMCNNVLLHLDDVQKALAQLCKIPKKFLIIRTLLGPDTIIAKKVYNNKNWKFSKIKVINQLSKNNTPKEYMNTNIYQYQYFKELIRKNRKFKKIIITRDNQFNAKNIIRSKKKEGLKDATYILGGKQVFSNVIQDYHFIIVKY